MDSKYTTILCSCKNSEHLVLLHYDSDDKMVYMEYHLCTLPFWKRIIVGIKYIFGFRSKYGEYGELIITEDNYKEFKPIIDFFENEN